MFTFQKRQRLGSYGSAMKRDQLPPVVQTGKEICIERDDHLLAWQ